VTFQWIAERLKGRTAERFEGTGKLKDARTSGHLSPGPAE
jgi:hypothetical protein